MPSYATSSSVVPAGPKKKQLGYSDDYYKAIYDLEESLKPRGGFWSQEDYNKSHGAEYDQRLDQINRQFFPEQYEMGPGQPGYKAPPGVNSVSAGTGGTATSVPATPSSTAVQTAVAGATGGPSTPQTNPFNVSPTPMTGNGAYGLVPGQLGLPDPAADLARQIPNLGALNLLGSNVIASYLGGDVPMDVQNKIRNAAAAYGVTSGLPGSGLARNIVPRDLGLTSLDLQRQGLASYGPFVGAVSGTQTVNPALQTQIAETNAINAAAPSPEAAQSRAEELYREYLNMTSRGGGSAIGGPSISALRPRTPRYPAIPTGYGGYGGFGGYSGTGGLPYDGGDYAVRTTPLVSNQSPSYSGGGGYYDVVPSQGSFGVLQSDQNPAPQYGLGDFGSYDPTIDYGDYLGGSGGYNFDDWASYWGG